MPWFNSSNWKVFIKLFHFWWTGASFDRRLPYLEFAGRMCHPHCGLRWQLNICPPPQSALILEEKILYFLWIIVGLATQAGRTSNKRNAQRWDINRAGIREGLKVKQNCLTLCNFHRPFTSTPCHQTTRLTVRGRGGVPPVDICGNCGPIFPCIKW